jgi:hypothetical protein
MRSAPERWKEKHTAAACIQPSNTEIPEDEGDEKELRSTWAMLIKKAIF